MSKNRIAKDIGIIISNKMEFNHAQDKWIYI